MAELTYTVTEAARALGISRPSMYALIHQEGFPTLKVGGRRLISKELLAEWVREQAGGRIKELSGATNTEQLKAEKVLEGSDSASTITENGGVVK